MTDNPVDVLIGLSDRLKVLKVQPQKEEAASLLTWFSGDGMGTVVPGVIDFLRRQTTGGLIPGARSPSRMSPVIPVVQRQATPLPPARTGLTPSTILQQQAVAAAAVALPSSPSLSPSTPMLGGIFATPQAVRRTGSIFAPAVPTVAELLQPPAKTERVQVFTSDPDLLDLNEFVPSGRIQEKDRRFYTTIEDKPTTTLQIEKDITDQLVGASKDDVHLYIRLRDKLGLESDEILPDDEALYTAWVRLGKRPLVFYLSRNYADKLRELKAAGLPVVRSTVLPVVGGAKPLVPELVVARRSPTTLSTSPGKVPVFPGGPVAPVAGGVIQPVDTGRATSFTSRQPGLIQLLIERGLDGDVSRNTIYITIYAATTGGIVQNVIATVLGVDSKDVQLTKHNGGYIAEQELLLGIAKNIEPIEITLLSRASETVKQEVVERVVPTSITIKIKGDVMDTALANKVEQTDPNYTVDGTVTVAVLKERLGSRLSEDPTNLLLEVGNTRLEDSDNVIQAWSDSGKQDFIVSRKVITQPRIKVPSIETIINRNNTLLQELNTIRDRAGLSVGDCSTITLEMQPIITELLQLQEMYQYYKYADEYVMLGRELADLTQRIDSASDTDQTALALEFARLVGELAKYGEGTKAFELLTKYDSS
ncbi:Hypothetical protein POVN_LOCUS358 [uncultured virus]|nr:Hypothetical protein POVN_LOCUS358 [uncultured virus]